ncbi:MAG: hypothetical protein J6Y29_01065 [Clostridiales bacterium]|nr:hypothetical protein [Clostridiales bacterium]
MDKNDLISDLESYVEERIIQITLLVFVLIILIKRDIRGGVIFVVTSAISYIRFYCISDLMDVVIKGQKDSLVHSLVNYGMSLLMTVVFLVIACFTFGGVYTLYGVIGSIIGSLIIVVFGILGGLSNF